MSRSIEGLRQLFHERLSSAASDTFYAEVLEVDHTERTCMARVGNVKYEDVLLYSVVKPEVPGAVVYPRIGSKVLVSRLEGSDRLYVSMFSEVESIVVTIDKNYSGGSDEDEDREEGSGSEEISCRIHDQGIGIACGEQTTVRIDREGVEARCEDVVCRLYNEGVDVECGEETETQVHMDRQGIEARTDQTRLKIDKDGFGLSSGQHNLLATLRKLCFQLSILQVPTPAGPSGIPANSSEFNKLSEEFSQYLNQ